MLRDQQPKTRPSGKRATLTLLEIPSRSIQEPETMSRARICRRSMTVSSRERLMPTTPLSHQTTSYQQQRQLASQIILNRPNQTNNASSSSYQKSKSRVMRRLEEFRRLDIRIPKVCHRFELSHLYRQSFILKTNLLFIFLKILFIQIPWGFGVLGFWGFGFRV